MDTDTNTVIASRQKEIATFYLADMLMGVDIACVEEINRQLELTIVPNAPACVRGVVGLRGEVVTVLDLRTRLGLTPQDLTPHCRNVIVRAAGERVGLLVDRIADVVAVRSEEIEPSPANVQGVDGRFFEGVYELDAELLVILDVEEVTASSVSDE